MNPVDRFARACLASAARRWPADLSETVARDWHAELDALWADPTLGWFVRRRRAVTFAGSLALSPAVEPEGAEPRTWRERLGGIGAALTMPAGVVGVTLLAAALSNVVHDASYGLGRHLSPAGRIAVGVGLVAVAAAAMSRVGVAVARHRGLPPAGWSVARAAGCTAPLGLAMYVFLLAGNRVPVMPFMGWVDVAPAVTAWTALMSLAVLGATRLAAAGRRGIGAVVGAAGALVALEVAAVGGSFHAAAALRLGVGSAPAWFPLALLPGGTVTFGGVVADGAVSFGGVPRSGPDLYASDLLLGNVSAMVGPLLLCSAFLIAYATARTGVAAPVPAAPVPATESPTGASRTVRIAAAGAAVVGLGGWAYLAALAPDPAPAQRIVAIALVVAALAVALSGRGAVVVPAAAAAALLVAADRVTGQLPRHGLASAAVLLAIGAASLYAAWRLSADQAPARTTAPGRGALLAAAVLAALAVPVCTGLVSATAGAPAGPVLVALSWWVAATAALAARRSPPHPAAAAAVIALPLAALLFAATMTTQAYLLHAPLAVGALAVARWDGSTRRLRQAARWLHLGAGAAVLGASVASALRQYDGLIGPALDRLRDNSTVFGFGFASHAAGRIALAVLVGVLAARCAVTAEARFARPNGDAGPR